MIKMLIVLHLFMLFIFATNLTDLSVTILASYYYENKTWKVL